MKILKKYSKSTYFALFLIIIWDALKAYTSISSPIFQLLILTPFIIIGLKANMNKTFLKNIFSYPISLWVFWIIYALVNTFLINGFHHHNNQNPFVFISAIVISLLFLAFIVSSKSKTSELINLLIWAYSTRLLFSFIFDSISVIGSDSYGRLGSEFNSNSIANGALFIIILIAIKKVRFENINKFDILFFVLAITAIYLSASKKVFISLILFALGYVFVFRSENLMKNFLKFSILISILGIFTFLSLKYSSVGLRLIDSFTKTQNVVNPEKMFDSRAAQYIYGFKIFIENPINGIGLTNFVHISKIPTPLHSEIMVQIAECGIIGFSIFLMFYYSILKNLFKIRSKIRVQRKISEIHIISICIMFILFFGIPIYYIPMMWVLIALSIRLIKENQSNSEMNIKISI